MDDKEIKNIEAWRKRLWNMAAYLPLILAVPLGVYLVASFFFKKPPDRINELARAVDHNTKILQGRIAALEQFTSTFHAGTIHDRIVHIAAAHEVTSVQLRLSRSEY